MTNESLNDKKYQYFGSDRSFYSGIQDIASGTAWTYVNFSGTLTGFGAAGNERSHRVAIVSSGVSQFQWSYNAGSTWAGEVWNGNAVTQDGVNVSGVFLRTEMVNSKVQVYAW